MLLPAILLTLPHQRSAAPQTLLAVSDGAGGDAVTKKPGRKSGTAGEAAKGAVPAPISLVLVDDNRLLREGIEHLIRAQPGFEVLAASADVDEALQTVREARPDVVLLDSGLEDHDSLSLTATVHGEVPEARVIVMGLLPLQEEIAKFVRAGASGFIMKNASIENFFATIRAVAGGAEVLPAGLTTSVFWQVARTAAEGSSNRIMEAVRLTGREREALDLLAEGLCDDEISLRLKIPVHVVRSRVHNILEKLALHSRLDAAASSAAQGASKPSQAERPSEG
jgi:DNA-binding NarL/FixJ family response regulator